MFPVLRLSSVRIELPSSSRMELIVHEGWTKCQLCKAKKQRKTWVRIMRSWNALVRLFEFETSKLKLRSSRLSRMQDAMRHYKWAISERPSTTLKSSRLAWISARMIWRRSKKAILSCMNPPLRRSNTWSYRKSSPRNTPQDRSDHCELRVEALF